MNSEQHYCCPERVAQQLNFLASEEGLTRQDFIEKILTDATHGTEVPSSFQTKTYISSEVLDTLKIKSQELEAGKEMVLNGEVPCFSVGREKSNNEQMYNKLFATS